MNNRKSLKEIFSLIFPELKYISRLEKLSKISVNYDIGNEILLAILLIDNSNNHEYFSHKYKVSNEIKENLNSIANDFTNKNILKKNLKKNIYLFGKKHLTNLNILNYCANNKVKIEEYFKISSIIKNFKIPKFPYDGNFLIKEGLKEGLLVGKTLELLENEWLDNNFNISNHKVKEIIASQKL